MDDSSQIHLPPSFIALYQAANGRLTLPRTELLARYEHCEDMTQLLTERALQLYHGGAANEEGVLSGIHAALGDAGTGLTAAEARWVTLRLAELLAWRSPLLPGNDATSD